MSKYTKRRCFETQRAKPWHIIKDSAILHDVYCGSYRYKVSNAEHLRWHVAVEEVPPGQIICSRCEKTIEGTNFKVDTE